MEKLFIQVLGTVAFCFMILILTHMSLYTFWEEKKNPALQEERRRERIMERAKGRSNYVTEHFTTCAVLMMIILIFMLWTLL